MAETKEAVSHLKVTPFTGQTTAELATAEVYHDGVILLDIGAKGVEGGEAPSLKVAKDGHVRPRISIERAETNDSADCVGTSANGRS